MEKHVTLVGALHIGYGAFHVLCALCAFTLIAGGGLLGGLDRRRGVRDRHHLLHRHDHRPLGDPDLGARHHRWCLAAETQVLGQVRGTRDLRAHPAQCPPRDRHRHLFTLGPGAGRDGKALRLWAQPVDCPAACPATHRPAPLGGSCTHRTQLRGSYRVIVRLR